jgi:hypothetical protein
MSDIHQIGDVVASGSDRSSAEMRAIIANAERVIANSADPTRLVSEAIQKVYMQSQREGDASVRILALCLMCDLRRRRQEAGLPPITGLRGSGR